jgi:parallel beta-helix repeat protein
LEGEAMVTNKKLHQLALISLAMILILSVISASASAATLKVGPHEKYKTIQKAINAAHDDDTIQVATGTYKENVKVTKSGLKIYGQKSGGSYTKYPKVYGFELKEGKAGNIVINGFYITKNGISIHYSGEKNIIQNNYFSNCGIEVVGTVSSGTLIKNNKITDGTIFFYDSLFNTVMGNTVTKSKIGIYIGDSSEVKVIKNNITYNQIGVLRVNNAGYLKDNTYIGNKINIKNIES